MTTPYIYTVKFYTNRKRYEYIRGNFTYPIRDRNNLVSLEMMQVCE